MLQVGHTDGRHKHLVVQLTAPGQLLVVLCDGARGEDAEELHRQRQRPAPLPAVTLLSPLRTSLIQQNIYMIILTSSMECCFPNKVWQEDHVCCWAGMTSKESNGQQRDIGVQPRVWQ